MIALNPTPTASTASASDQRLECPTHQLPLTEAGTRMLHRLNEVFDVLERDGLTKGNSADTSRDETSIHAHL